jgi:hypothetical protein
MPNTTDTPQRLPLYTPLSTRTAFPPFSKDCRLYNGFVEQDFDQRYWIYKRVGLGMTPVYTVPPDPVHGSAAEQGYGLWTVPGSNVLFSVWGNGSVYAKWPAENWFHAGTVPADAPVFFETALLATQPGMMGERVVVIGDTYNNNAFLENPASGAYTPTTFGPLPSEFEFPQAWGYVYLNGLFYVMDKQGIIWNTLQFEGALSFDPVSYMPANSNPDYGVAIARQLSYLIAIKQQSVQVFYDAGNSPGSPLEVVPDSQMPFGCLTGSSLQSIDNSLFWITYNETVSPQIVRVDNLVPQIVSTPAVDRILDNIKLDSTLGSSLAVRSWVLKHGGHRFYGLTLVNNNITLVHDIDQRAWYIWTDAAGNYWPIVGMAYIPPLPEVEGVHVAQHTSNGNLYPLDGDYAFPNDYGNVVPVDLYTPNFDAGVDRRKHLNLLRIDADVVTGSTLQVRYSDDDYMSWSNFREVDLSRERPFLDRNGTFYRRAYHFRHKRNTTLRIKAVDLQLDVGTL